MLKNSIKQLLTSRCMLVNTCRLKHENWNSRNELYYPHLSGQSELKQIQTRDVLRPSVNLTPERRAEIYLARPDVPYSYKKMWYVCKLVRNLWFEDAIGQLSFVSTKGARLMEECLQAAQELAVKEHNVEFKWNLHVAFASVHRYRLEKDIIWHTKSEKFEQTNYFGKGRRPYSNILIMLKEGPPEPAKVRVTGFEKEEHFYKQLDDREIKDTI